MATSGQEETNFEIKKEGHCKIAPFVCGLCNCSYGQFVSFYKHFKKHSEEVGQDSFHICEDLPSSERDGCEDQSESPEIQTFNCGICAASFVSVCLLHEHMEKHESKGSYTLDMQSKTGYPSSKQYPYVNLGNAVSDSQRTLDLSSVQSGVRSKRSRLSKRGYPGDTDSLPESEMRNAAKRGRPSVYVPPPEMGIRTRKDRSSKSETPKGTSVASEVEVLSRKGRSPRHGGEDINVVTPPREMKARKGTLQKHKHSKNSNPKKSVIIKSEPFETTNDAWLKKVTDKAQEDDMDDAEDHFESYSNLAIEDNGMDTFDDDFNDYDTDEEEEEKEEEIASTGHAEDTESAGKDATNKADSQHTEAGCMKAEADKVENLKAESPETEEQYNFRQKRTSLPPVKSSAKKKIPGKKTFLFCEVCGMKRAEHLLVKHVEETHGGVELSKEFKETLEGLKSAELRQKKIIKKPKDEQNEDSDYEPEYYRPLSKTKRAELLQSDRYGNRVTFTKCKDCGMMIYMRCVKAHKKAHKKNPDKYKPENLHNCEKCDRVILKTSLNVHKCFPIDKEVREKIKKEYTIQEGEENRDRYYIQGRRDKRIPYTKCTHCEMFIPLFRIRNHENVHMTYRGKRKYRPENLTKCEFCSRVLFKWKMSRHQCILIVKKDKESEEEGEAAEGEGMEKMRKKKPLMIACAICGEMVKRVRMKKHILYHSEDSPFKCPKCPKAYKTPDSLKSHEATNHTARKFQCDQCPWAFPTMSGLKIHYTQHTGERPYACSICDKAFSREGNLKDHMFTHSEECNVQCKECPMRFKTKKYLNAHIRSTHKQTKHWICSWPECAKRFHSGSSLRRHMLIHTGIKPEQCPHCELAFSQRPELKNHMIRKHNKNKLPPPNNGKLIQSNLGKTSTTLNTDKLPPPNNDNPYSEATTIFIKRPGPHDDPNQPDNTLKTLSFTNAMSEAESQKLQEQLAEQVKKSKLGDRNPGSNRQKTVSSVHRRFNMKAQSTYTGSSKTTSKPETSDEDTEDNEILAAVEKLQETKSEPMASDEQSVQGTRITNEEVLPDASILPSFSNTRPEHGTRDISSEVIQETNSSPFLSNSIPDMRIGITNFPIMPVASGSSIHRQAKPELGTSNTNSSMLQGASIHPWFSNSYRF